MRDLTAGEECQAAAKTMSAFVDANQGAIPSLLVREAMGLAIFRGAQGVAVMRLPNGDWSAPCAILLESSKTPVQEGQESILLFMTEGSVYSLVTRARLALNETHRFAPGPLNTPPASSGAPVDVYVYVRFNGGFTPADLIVSFMSGWTVKEDTARHSRWHGESVTWFDVLCNKISVDRSSVGNALYVVLNLAAGSASEAARSSGKKNYAEIESWASVAPSVSKARLQQQQQSSSNGSSAGPNGAQGDGSRSLFGIGHHHHHHHNDFHDVHAHQHLYNQPTAFGSFGYGGGSAFIPPPPPPGMMVPMTTGMPVYATPMGAPMGVPMGGAYGAPPGMVYAQPVVTVPGYYGATPAPMVPVATTMPGYAPTPAYFPGSGTGASVSFGFSSRSVNDPTL